MDKPYGAIFGGVHGNNFKKVVLLLDKVCKTV